jgi:hypothetical protein
MKVMAEASRELEREKIDVQLQLFVQQMEYHPQPLLQNPPIAKPRAVILYPNLTIPRECYAK